MLWSGVMSAPDLPRVAAAIWRIESAKLIAVLARLLQSVDLAEELAQDAFVEALESWRKNGIPDNPGAWLMTAARHRALAEAEREVTHAATLTRNARERALFLGRALDYARQR